MPTCIKWGKERHQECTETRDEGYNECAESRDEGYDSCSSWGWFSWVCVAWTWVSNIVCVGWTWISNIVCVAWTWVTTAVCVVWDVVTTVVNAVLVTVESVFGWVLSLVALIIELIESIPVLGTLIRWIINGVTAVVNIIISLGDALLGLVGIRPEKKLKVCTIILRDENGVTTASLDFAKAILQKAVDVYKRDANVRIIPLAPFKYSTGFADAETVDDSWVITDGSNSDATLLDVPCNAAGAGADWLLTGSGFQLKSSTFCFFGSWRRVIGYGAPVTCFIVRSIPGASGCSLWITDYATIDGDTVVPPPNPRVLGHEVGHSCNLWHLCVDDDNRNLMAIQEACDPASSTTPDYADPRMSDWQVLLVRASKHVTYF